MYQKSYEQKTIEQMVYSQTPIDTIKYIYEDRNFIEVTGSAGTNNLTYKFYNNGMVVEK